MATVLSIFMDPGSNLIRLSDIKSRYHNDKRSPTDSLRKLKKQARYIN